MARRTAQKDTGQTKVAGVIKRSNGNSDADGTKQGVDEATPWFKKSESDNTGPGGEGTDNTGADAKGADNAGDIDTQTESVVLKKRGRPRGSSSAPKPVAIGREQLTNMLAVTSGIFALMTKTPEWALSKEEAQSVGEASVNVLRHYDIVAPSEKIQDWLIFVGTIIAVGRPHFAAFKERKASQKKVVTQTPIEGFGSLPQQDMSPQPVHGDWLNKEQTL